MTGFRIEKACVYCGFFHAKDYSDVVDTPQEWVQQVCSVAKMQASHVRQRAGLPPYEKPAIKESNTPELVKVAIPEPKPGPGIPDVEALNRAARQPPVLHVKFRRIHGHAGQPKQAYRHDAGWDLEICEEAMLQPGQWQNLHTGIEAAIPEGYWGHILARSSTWRHHNIRVEPAVIDASYRGELLVYAVSTLKEPQVVKVGQRLAQIIIVPLPNVEWLEQMNLPVGERGNRGYGSSGGQG